MTKKEILLLQNKSAGELSQDEIRKQREIFKSKKREKKLIQGEDPDHPIELSFIKRPILYLPHHGHSNRKGFKFSLMTYNCLAQAMIRREVFSDSGPALKWFRRSKVLMNEITYYNPDILCLQEIDDFQYENFWKDQLESNLNMNTFYYKQKIKHHGVLIAWKKSIFKQVDHMVVDFDDVKTSNIARRTITRNIAMYVALKFNDEFITKNFPNLLHSFDQNDIGFIISTTHLFWHPFGTFERTRQCYILLEKMKKFIDILNVKDHLKTHWYPFICGDFNSTPRDAPYLSMTSKPIEYTGREKKVIECSTAYKFSKRRNGEIGDSDEEEEKKLINQPKDMVPDSFTPTIEQAKLVHQLQSLHNQLALRATSLYGLAYKIVDPSNVNINNDRGEPEFTSWAKSWHGVLDYIMYVDNWDINEPPSEIGESLEEFEKNNQLLIKGLLKMPLNKDMPFHTQPFEREYPSDHISILCEMEILDSRLQ
ncbi:hypothetical protein TBLA_0D03300 [Henningerozyma blattae CBS 6284]|uniref:Endonuclease/exonuclease/phosphatase domain-containing protein n=1 Tax=Henningerozyma blattae (strain ATCC 34711 / CBS 6284 / DSM 70876 / NBRC 10599 / NRRL Y-10934 / UCD 77-7) TaxID=1071380 RepID=I2H378_HENB6|nr:hypothetical protein TBLA_0D03300 [Tetrapisispora blattae CBS 6284]CCH60830.1 hypothetical protein TBLA_0D03300 [Tetrapisispora blattae CBS 6284]